MTSWGKTPRLLMAACVLALGLCLALILAQRWPAPPEKVILNTASGQKDALMPGQGAAKGLQGLVPLVTPMQGERIPINHASKEELMTLPGIGPHLAGLMVEARDRQPFYFPEDLMTVPGIGEKRIKQLRDLIQVP